MVVDNFGKHWSYDMTYRIADTSHDSDYFYDAILHELGHAQLLNHVDDTTSLMYYTASTNTRKNILSGTYPGPQTLYGAFDVVNTSAVNTPPCSYGILVRSSRTCIDSTLAVPSISKNEYNLTLYPNPASNTISIGYQLSQNANIQFLVTDCVGRQLVILNEGSKPPGQYTRQINISGWAQGVYFFIADINGEAHTVKFIKL
jgi:hypothetical protein